MVNIDADLSRFEFACVKMQIKGTPVVILLIYKSGSTNVTNNFLSKLSIVLEALALYNCITMICGDLNLKLLDPIHPPQY